jgi:hypothetical protein
MSFRSGFADSIARRETPCSLVNFDSRLDLCSRRRFEHVGEERWHRKFSYQDELFSLGYLLLSFSVRRWGGNDSFALDCGFAVPVRDGGRAETQAARSGGQDGIKLATGRSRTRTKMKLAYGAN